MNEVWAIVLAAGESTRMKANKLLLPWENGSVISSVIGRIRPSGVGGILLVLGAYAQEIRQATVSEDVSYCNNERYKDGMLSSVQCGFRHLPEDIRAALVFLGDQPMTSPMVAAALIKAWRSSGRGICLPVFGGRRGHPVLIDRKYRDEIDRLDPEVGLKGLMLGHPEDILEVDTPLEAILRDIDTRDDYERETRKF